MSKKESAVPSKERLMSVDALRGFDMFWIIGGDTLLKTFIVAVAGSVPAGLAYHLSHPEWTGFSAWDMIMPLFLFVVGTSMPFAFSKRLESGEKSKVYLRILRRVVILFILGMIAQGNLLAFDLSKLRLYSNTLQAIASGYLVAAILLLNVSIAWQSISIVILLIGYWALLQFMPIPGHGAGFLDPELNFARYFEELALGRFRDRWTYTWTLSSMGFSATVLLGVMSGHILRADKPHKTRLLWLIGAGLGCLILGWLWGLWHPIIKHIWTSSMVLWSGGWCFLLLAIFYGIIDVLGFKKWAFPFVVIGMNAIAVYMVTRLFDFRILADTVIKGLAAQIGAYGDFLRAVVAFAIIWGILYYMYKKKTFIKV